MSDALVGLNGEQRAVAQTTEGPVLVLAGAGSGKTRALVHRLAYILEQGLAAPEEILAVTFTNKAAAEMKERVGRILAREGVSPCLGTFHSLGARLTREYAPYVGRSRSFTILDEQDSVRLAKQAMERVGMARIYWPGQMRAIISRAKNEGELPQAEDMRAVYEEYQRLLKAHDACDFDDLLVLPVRLLAAEESVRQALQRRWRYLSVDEYQDTNVLQVKLLELLLSPARNVCVVGDDYQAIYSWRGARVDHIRQFAQQFADCRVLTLTQNYRSTPQVLEAANAVMAQQDDAARRLWTLRPASGQPVQLVQLPSDREEVHWVREQIEAQMEGGGRLADCAVLYRTNAQSRLFEEEFLRREIPYTVVGGFRFYERREVKDALALLQLAHHERGGIAAQRIAGALWRGIGPKTVAAWQASAEAAGHSIREELFRQSVRRPQLTSVMQAVRAAGARSFATVAAELQYLLTASGYLAALARESDHEERRENLAELCSVASVYTQAEEFLEAVALLTDLDRVEATPLRQGFAGQGRVMCMTLHAAKGLEFPQVFIAGCEEGLLPHANSLDEREKLEEERRLLYVGMTRARERLTVSHAQRRLWHGRLTMSIPSRFLADLPESVARLSPEQAYEPVSDDLISYAIPEF